MTLQKAMRVRAELKKMSAALMDLLKRVPIQVSYEKEKPSEEKLVEKREEKISRLDGCTYEEVVQKLISITDAIYELNVAIEKANRNGHELLYKEGALKAKIKFVNYLIAEERNITAESYTIESDYEHPDSNGNFKRIRVPLYSYSLLKPDALGSSLTKVQKSLVRELESVRDELAAFNARATVDYEVPEGLL